ncbi:MAG: insulinase family protein [Deltaproteobacteria bacterium]|nr:insulinase family protein [Deltaproteobacteria bacterium]
MRKFILALLMIVTVSASAFAAGWDGVKEYTLDNGLKVLLMEEHKAPVATFQIWYRIGSRNELPGNTGMSHLLEHMMFKGTKKYGPKTFSQTVQRNGGNDNAFTSKDYTAYFETFSSDRIWLSLDMESDRMRGLLLDPKEFNSERDVVKEERRLNHEDDPESALYEKMMEVAFLNHPYRIPTIGWMDDLTNMTVEDLKVHYDTHYVPNNATIVVVGDFESEKMLSEIKKQFASIPKGAEPRRVTIEEPLQKGERRLFLKKEAELPVLIAGYHVPALTHKDSYPLSLLELILSAGKRSRLYKSIVYEKQMALYAGGDYSMVSTDPSMFYLYAASMPGKPLEEVEKAIYAEIDKFKIEPVSEKELTKAKNQIEASFIMGQDSNFNRAMLLGQYETVASWKLLDKYVDEMRKVTAEDVMRVAKQYFSEDNRTVGILVPVKEEVKK